MNIHVRLRIWMELRMRFSNGDEYTRKVEDMDGIKDEVVHVDQTYVC